MSGKKTGVIIVDRIYVEEDRVLFYERSTGLIKFHVIADKSQADSVLVGDRIRYEECGINFGWFISKVS